MNINRALQFYKFVLKLIDVIVDLYVGDRTKVWGDVGGDGAYKWD